MSDPTDPSTDIENVNEAYRLMQEDRDFLLARVAELETALTAQTEAFHALRDALGDDVDDLDWTALDAAVRVAAGGDTDD